MAALDPVTKQRLDSALLAVAKRVPLAAAYFFGSRAEGRGDRWSDYDVAVFIGGTEGWDLTDLAQFAAAVQGEAGDDIELHAFPAAAWPTPHPASFAAYILQHGVPLELPAAA
jgi:predicted nucleotidyltransferase